MTPASEDQTKEAMETLRPGQRFHEHHLLWVEILAIEKGIVAVKETPDTLRQTAHGYRFFRTKDAFRKAYQNQDGSYWISFDPHPGTPYEGSLLQLLLQTTDTDSAHVKELIARLEK